MNRVYLGLGTNIGNREKNLFRARKLLEEGGIFIDAESGVDETDPVDCTDQPKFLNQVIRIKTEMSPHDMIDCICSIEYTMGRVRSAPKGPRVIDIDILLFGDTVMKDDVLCIPHPEIKNRPFIMRHLVQLDAYIADPETGIPYSEVLHGKQ